MVHFTPSPTLTHYTNYEVTGTVVIEIRSPDCMPMTVTLPISANSALGDLTVWTSGTSAMTYSFFLSTDSMDADLQDDINAIDEMVDRNLEGYEVVYGVRSSRKKDTFFKRTTAQGFYKVMRAMGVETVYNHADYRLMSRRALEALSEFEEVNLFLRGIVPLVGFKSTQVTYERGERFAGESKYPLKKMLAFATEGITSMSVRPIRLITTLGFLVFLFSLGVLVYSIIRKFTGYTVPGWAFLAVSIWALGGVQLLAIGVIGEYIGKIYLETKHRPKFIVAEYLNDD
jgi:hypothetical protein